MFNYTRGELSLPAYRTHAGEQILKDSFAVLRYGDYFAAYRRHPELKALASDAKPCHTWTRGELRPRHVHAAGITRIGRESNRLADQSLPADDESEAVIEYPGRRTCAGCKIPVTGRRKWCSEACRKRYAHNTRRAPLSLEVNRATRPHRAGRDTARLHPDGRSSVHTRGRK